MTRSTLLAAFAGSLACVSMAQAQWTPSGSPFAGPYTVVGTGTFFQSIDLNGASAPAGTYGKATVTADWAFVTGSSTSTLLWQNDSRMALTNAAVDGVAAVPGGVTIHFGGTGGAAPTTATGNQNPGTVRYDNVNLSTFYTGGNPLFLAFRSNFATGGNFTWSNINVTLTPPPAPPVNETCATAIDLSSGANAALTGVNTNFAGPAQEIGGANSATLAPSPFSCQATVSRATWYKFTPTTSASYVVGSCTTTGQATQNNMANNVVAIFDGSAGCGSLTSLACSTTTCTGGVQTGATSLTAGTDYYIAVARTGTTALGAAEVRSQIFIGRPDAAVCGSNTETEPNDTRATANSFTLNVGDTICGTTTGTSASGGGLATYDFYKIKTPANAGIKRNRIRVASFPAGHTLSLRGFGSTAGVINTTESEIQASSTSSSPARMIQWYTLGNGTDANDREITLRVGGTTSTTGQYSLNYVASDDVTPINLSRDIRPGSVTITTVGQTGATQGDTDMWMYDSNYNPIPGFGNDDTFNSASTGSTDRKSVV